VYSGTSGVALGPVWPVPMPRQGGLDGALEKGVPIPYPPLEYAHRRTITCEGKTRWQCRQKDPRVDTQEEIDDTLEHLKVWNLPRAVRLALLNRLDDLFRRGRLEVGFAEGRVQNLLDLLIDESDRAVRGRMFEVTERAMSANDPLTPALHELIVHLHDDDPALICYALVLLPLCAALHYVPLVEQDRALANDFVRRNAE
jgi:hypothetical protein